MSDENKKIARRLMEEGWNKGRLDVVDELMSSGCRFHDPVFPSLKSGVDNYKQHIQTCRTGFPDLKFTIEDTIAERNEVVLHWTTHGTHRGEFLGMPASNKSATVSGTSIILAESLSQRVRSWIGRQRLWLRGRIGLPTRVPTVA